MSCVAEAKAVMTKRMSEKVKTPMDVWPAAMVAASGWGMLSVSSTKASVISSCMVTIHQRFVRMMSTKGLHSGLMVQGR